MVISGMATYNQDDHNLAPAEPTQSRFYIQDKLEFKDVVVQLGVSFETIDTQAMAPDSDNDGYGDSDGFNNLYFNRQRVNRNGDGNGNYVWKKVKKETATHPRIGVSFPVSDQYCIPCKLWYSLAVCTYVILISFRLTTIS
jgi:hypothetical protein